MIKGIKTSIFLMLPFVLASCSSGNANGIPSLSDFVSIASTDKINVASSLYKVIQAVGTADVTTPSSSSSSSSASSGGSSLAHECYFYTDKNFSYTSNTEAFLGYSNLSKGLYYLVNATTNIGNVYDIETPLETKRSVAQQIINDDYSAISLAYDEMKSFVGKTPAEMNVSSFSLLHSDIGATVGYQLRFRTDGDTTYTDTYSYITLNKTGDGTFAFTDYVRREVKTNKSNGGYSSKNLEYKLSVVDVFAKMAFNSANYVLSLAGLDLSTVPSSVEDQPL